MSRHAEVWTQPQTGSFTKKIAHLPVSRAGFRRELSTVGSGQVTVPANYRRLNDIIYPANNTGSVIRLFEEGTNIASFFVSEADYADDEQGEVTLSGVGIEAGLDYGIVYPWDWTPGATETYFPDWVYGFGSNELAPDLVDDEPMYPLINGDAEDGSTTGWSTHGSDVTIFQVVNNAANAYEGDHFFQINPGPFHSGIKQQIRVWPGKRNQFTAKLKEPGGLGKRFTMAATITEGAVSHGTNQFEFDDQTQVELDNVAPNGEGTPGGSTDGTWQDFSLDVTWGDDQEFTDLIIQFDHHDDEDGPEYWVDAVTMAGFGVGVGDWNPVGTEWLDAFEGRDTEAHTPGGRSVYLQFTGIGQPLGGAGVNQRVVFEEGAPYVAEVWVRTPSASNPTVRLALEQFDGSAAFGAVTEDLAQDTWTLLRLEVDPPEGVFQGLLTIAWDETYASSLYIDDEILRTGLAEATAGAIVQEHMDLMVARGALDWIKYDSFDDTTDSNGVAWPEEMAIRVPRGMSMRQLLDELAGWGYEWEVIWNDSASQYELKLYTKYTGSSGGAGSANSVRLIKGKSFRTGTVRLRDAGGNAFLAEGLEGKLYEKVSAALITAYGRREAYLPQERTEDSLSLESLIDHNLVQSVADQHGAKVSVFQRPLPVLDFDLGSAIEIDIPPHLPDDSYRVIGYTGAWDADDSLPTYSLEFSSKVYIEPFGGTTSSVTSDALNYLLGKYKGLPDIDRLRGSLTSDEDTDFASVFTVGIASYQSRQEVKNHADIIGRGTGDEEALRAAADIVRVFGAGKGRILLSEGDFMLSSGAVIEIPADCVLEGVGKFTTRIVYPNGGSEPEFRAGGDGVHFRRFGVFEGAGGC